VAHIPTNKQNESVEDLQAALEWFVEIVEDLEE
jgi:hypothetical protein